MHTRVTIPIRFERRVCQHIALVLLRCNEIRDISLYATELRNVGAGECACIDATFIDTWGFRATCFLNEYLVSRIRKGA